MHSAFGGRFFYRLLCLSLGSHKYNVPAARHHVGKQFFCYHQTRQCFADVDNVYLSAFAEYKRRHFRVPVIGAVPEMDARANQLLCQLFSHKDLQKPYLTSHNFTERQKPGQQS
jgi:hypothetical protein